MPKNKKNIINVNIGSYIWKTLVVIILIFIITFCLVVSMLSIYFLKLLSGSEALDLDNYKVNYTTIIYYKDKKTGEDKELKRVFKDENRIWIDIDKMPKCVMRAVIATEDQRYLQHKGVDWKRTAGAFLNEIFHIYGSRQGGSTITQQLIKNITRKNEVKYERKIREILEAIYLEKNYSKEQIMEAYLNIVYFESGAYGIQAAATAYFGKDAKDLTLVEAASIIGITKNPAKYNPFKNPEENKIRRNYILTKMFDLGLIKDEEVYKKALEEDIKLVEKNVSDEDEPKVQSYFVDHLMEEVIDDLVAEKGYTRAYAEDQLLSGGFRIYSTVDLDIQDHLERKFEDDRTFLGTTGANKPQSAMVILDPNGKVLGLVGGRGKKEAARIYNRATQAVRQPGSTMKPIAVYGPAIEYDLATYSSIWNDSPHQQRNGKPWPNNYYERYYGRMTIDKAIQMSVNTVAVKVCNELTPKKSFDFLTKKLKMSTLVENERKNGRVYSDVDLAPMALGSVTKGVTVLELAGAYQIYANGGFFTRPYSYTKILDSKGNLVLEKDISQTSVISSETAMIMNKLLQRVVNGPNGTGRTAKFGSLPIAGKTGSTSNNCDLWFVGMTPYYIGVLWYGHDIPSRVVYGWYPPPIIWKNVMEGLHQNLPYLDFPVSNGVIEANYCSQTGYIAGPYCPVGGKGFYKASNKSSTCPVHTSATRVDSQQTETKENSAGQGNVNNNQQQPTETKENSAGQENINNNQQQPTETKENSAGQENINNNQQQQTETKENAAGQENINNNQ